MHRLRMQRSVVAVLVLLALLLQGTWVLAGTTGSITGIVTDTVSGRAVRDATVTAASASQAASVQTDSSGRYNFVSLAPDTYTLTFSKQGYQSAPQAGVTVQADQSLTINLGVASSLQTIGRVGTRASSTLLRPGQTASEYSVNPAQQAAAAPLGGGTNLNSAYSAIASVPGVLVPLTNTSWGQSIFIRGGDYTQTGNEVDGIPINRSFDQYASGQLSSLGNQEIQVYTGNAPADAQAVGLAGFVNQVIRTGTYPGSINATLGIGTPTKYNHANLEVAGASPNRLFTYYAGTGGYSQEFRLVDQFNGAGFLARTGNGSVYNYVAAGCLGPHPTVGCYQNVSPFLGGAPLGPNGFAFADEVWGYENHINDRETIANIHVGIKHPRDGNHDDIQLLYDYGNSQTYPNSSMDAWRTSLRDNANGSVGTIPFVTDAFGNPTCPAPAIGGTYAGVPTTCGGPVIPFYRDQNQYMGPRNAPLTPANIGNVVNFAFPASPSGRPLGAPADFARQDGEQNAFAIAKVQYQHNIAEKGYVPLYGYTKDSDRLDNGLIGLYQNFVSLFSPDYQISSHSKGVVLNSAYQIAPQHLLSLNVGYVTSNTTRYRNDVAGGLPESKVAYLLNSQNPAGGCYSIVARLVSCTSATAAGFALPAVNAPPAALHPSPGTSPAL